MYCRVCTVPDIVAERDCTILYVSDFPDVVQIKCEYGTAG